MTKLFTILGFTAAALLAAVLWALGVHIEPSTPRVHEVPQVCWRYFDGSHFCGESSLYGPVAHCIWMGDGATSCDVQFAVTVIET